jgi:hypothetical protein
LSDGNAATTAPQHVVIRFSDDLYSVGDMIGEHVAVLERKGAVWLGKFGKPLAIKRVASMNEQVAAGTATYVYLVRKRPGSGGYDAFRGSVLQFSREVDDIEPDLVPAYYDAMDLWGVVGFWVKLSAIVELPADALDDLRVQRSGMVLTESLRASVAGMFIVERRKTKPGAAN